MKHLSSLLLLAACSVVPEAIDPSVPEVGIELVIVGNENVSRGDALKALSFDLSEFESQGYSRAAADDVAYALEAHYLSLGYRLAEVEEKLTQEGDSVHLHLTVVEGPQTIVDEDAIRAEGVTVFTQEEVVAFFNGPRLGTLGRGDLIFQDSRVRGVASSMIDEYVHRGYLDVEVEGVEVSFSEDGTRALLSVKAVEGARYDVGRIAFAEGTERAGDPSLFDKYRFDEKAGGRRVFDPRLPFELRGELREVLASEGHPDSRVTVEAEKNVESSAVDLTITLEPGPLVKLGEIRFEGNELTGRAFLLSRMHLESGAPFTSTAARASLNRIYNTGLFKSATFTLVPTGDEEGQDPVVRDLVVAIEEGPTREYWLEPGYGSYELLRLTLGGREKNLFGTGRQLRAETTAAIRALRAEAAFTDPWFFGTELIFEVPVKFERRDHPSFVGTSTGIGTTWTKQWDGHRHTTSFGYQFKRSEVDDVEIVDALAAEALADVDLSSLIIAQRLDRRDNIFLPTSGHLAQLAVEWGDRSIGSELDYIRANLKLAGYHSLIEDELVLAAALRTGVIVPRGQDNTIPLQERYTNGGGNTVRAFSEDDLGPQDSAGNPLGGEAQTVLNIELRQQLAAFEEFPGWTKSFEIALFADAGNIAADASEWAEFKDIRHGYGIGLRYLLPVGPLRLDVGWNPDPGPGEDEFVPHFALGISF